jgi:hypothetical protein
MRTEGIGQRESYSYFLLRYALCAMPSATVTEVRD